MSTSVNFTRILRYGFTNLFRHRLLSVTAIVVMIICLIVFSSLLLLNQLAGLSAQNLRDRVDVSVFFKLDVQESRIFEIKSDFEKLEEVKSIKYVSAEMALSDFSETHKNDPEIQKSLEELEINPLPASLIVTAKDLDLYPVIVSKIEHSRFQPLIKNINYENSRDLIETLTKITSGLRNFGILIASVFGLVAVLVMFNTLRLTIFSRREEIEIMRLVGASNWYIRGPYLVEGVLYGLIGSAISALILYPLIIYLIPKIGQFFKLTFPADSYFTGYFWLLVILQTGLGVLLGTISSIIATRRHLKI